MHYDNKYRLAAFEWLSQQIAIHGDILPSRLLKSFIYQGVHIPLIGMKGMWKPKIFPEYPISIMTSFNSPYKDTFSNEKILEYKYRGTDPNHSDNVALRKAMQNKVPLIYFHAIGPAKYSAIFPVFIVGCDDSNLTFRVIADDVQYLRTRNEEATSDVNDADEGDRRYYITTMVKQRLHQQSFRARVLAAYNTKCTVCSFRHDEILDAAHIIPDGEPNGEPIVINGLSLCKFHHAAFDSNILGIDPEFIVSIRDDIQAEIDGPMLKYGLQGLHGNMINLPREKKYWPDRERLEIRYNRFLKAG